MAIHSSLRSNKGFTLVELMIVVTIIGVLASLAIVGYSRFTTSAKVSNLEALAQEVAVGQNDPLRSEYYPTNGTPFTYDGSSPNQLAQKKLKTFLKVNPNNISPDVVLNVCAGNTGDACAGQCCNGINFDTNAGPWYVIRAEQNIDGNAATAPTAVIKTSSNKFTVTLNHGQ